jgi:hypothetical protein
MSPGARPPATLALPTKPDHGREHDGCDYQIGVYLRLLTSLRCFAQMSPSIRTYIAVAICFSSAVLGAIAIHRDWGSVSSVAFNVACPWFLSGSWLAGDFTREGWKRINKSMAAIYQDAKQRKLPKAPPLARVMNSGGGIMMLAGIVGWFV